MAQPRKTEQQIRVRNRTVRRHRRVLVTVLVVLILLAAGVAVFWMMSSSDGDSVGLFSVSRIEVRGSSRYDEDSLIAASGISVGQSLFSVNKTRAVEQITEQFPYLGTVTVNSVSFSTIRIEVEETETLGAVYASGNWLVAGANNRVLEIMPVQEDRPPRCLYIKGAAVSGAQVGDTALEEESYRLAVQLVATAAQTGLDGISEIDIADKIALAARWNDRLTILFGSSVNLRDKMEVSAAVIRELLDKRRTTGEILEGELDVTAYPSEDVSKPKSVYIPPEVIAARTTTTTPTAPPEDGGDEP